MATKSRTKTKTAARTVRARTVAASPVMERAVSKTKKLARSVGAKVRSTSPKARKGIAAAAAGLAVAAITARLMTKRKKKRSLW